MSTINMQVMSTIVAFEDEIKMQLKYLENFKPQKSLSVPMQKRTMFCGTGDSFVAALLAQVFSNFRIKAMDPLEMANNPSILNGHRVYLISISGNTISNIRLAKLLRNATAITANPKSKLAKSCQNLIHLEFRNAEIPTSGSISFLSSALTCISLVGKMKLGNYQRVFKIASGMAKRKIYGKVYILGNLFSFPIAMFCAAKLYEVLGIDAHYERIEQFSHMGLFSLKKGDTVIIFEKRNEYNKKLATHLKKCGLHVIRMEPPSNDTIQQILFFIFVSELLALHLAKEKNKRDCFFVEAKKLRNASSAMIY